MPTTPTHFAVVWNACLWTTSPAATVPCDCDSYRPPWGGRCSQSGAEWYGERREGGRGEKGREEVVNNRERATEEGQEETKTLQNNKTNTYAKEKEDNKRIIRKYQDGVYL